MKTKVLFSFVILLAGVFVWNGIYAQIQANYKHPTHFTGVKNTGNNMTLGIPESAWITRPVAGDEIGAFNESGQLVGASVYPGNNMALTIWGDDETTTDKDGTSTGTKYTLRLWHHDTGAEDEIIVKSWIKGSDIYQTNEIAVIEKIDLREFIAANEVFALEQNIPNPARESTRIIFSVPKSCEVRLALFTTEGKLVKDFFNENVKAGSHEVDLQLSDLAAGTYYYKLLTSEYSDTKTLNVVK